MDDIIIHSPGLSQSGHACIFAAPWHIQLKDSGDHVTPDQQTPRTRPRFDFTDPKEEWLLPPSLLQQLHLSNTTQGKVSCSQQSCCDSDSTELYGQIIFGDWFCVADTVSVGGFITLTPVKTSSFIH